MNENENVTNIKKAIDSEIKHSLTREGIDINTISDKIDNKVLITVYF
jgi:hypothetical protein